MSTIASAPSATDRSRGRAFFWAGIAAFLLGPALVVVQFRQNYLAVPWYCPVLATLGALLLLVAERRRGTILRKVVMLVVLCLAGLEWAVLVEFMKLPPYKGPLEVGKPFPAFHSTRADGRPFTQADLRDGSRHVLVFFRGRW